MASASMSIIIIVIVIVIIIIRYASWERQHIHMELLENGCIMGKLLPVSDLPHMRI